MPLKIKTMGLKPFDIPLRIYAENVEEAKKVKECIQDVSGGFTIVGSDLIAFHAFYKRNEGVMKPAILDCMRNGWTAAPKHAFKIMSLK